MTDPTCAIAYLRCSTSSQNLSPETQREAIHVLGWMMSHASQWLSARDSTAPCARRR